MSVRMHSTIIQHVVDAIVENIELLSGAVRFRLEFQFVPLHRVVSCESVYAPVAPHLLVYFAPVLFATLGFSFMAGARRLFG